MAELKPKRVITAAVYARYSSEMQSSSSARDQVERIRDLAARDQIASRMYPGARVAIAEEWIQTDEAISGKIAGRRGYQIILEGVRRKAFELLIVDDLSRLTRSLGDLFELYRLLKHHDVELISHSDRVSSADPNAKTLFQVKGMVADLGNDAHSERTLRGLEARARDLFSTGMKPFGFGSEATRIEKRKGKEVRSHFKILIVEKNARVVREIFELYAQGFGKTYISKLLNSRGTPTPTTRSTGWKDSLLFSILTNEKYIGRWNYRKKTYSVDPDSNRKVPKTRPRDEWVTTVREDLRIVPQSIWEQVQAKITENKKEKREAMAPRVRLFGKKSALDTHYLLSGAMQCSECGMMLTIVSGRRDGYYGCAGAHRQGVCSSKYLLRRRKAESSFIEHFKEKILENDSLIRVCAEEYNLEMKNSLRNAPDRKRDIDAQIAELEGEIKNLVRFITEGRAGDLETISNAIRERESKLAKLTEQAQGLATMPRPNILVTPLSIRQGLERVIDVMERKGERYNEKARAMLTGPMTISKEGNYLQVRGAFDMGVALTGSFHREIALPLSRQLNPLPVSFIELIDYQIQLVG